MLKNYTTQDLILYLYNETGLTDTVLVQNAIDHDMEVEEEFNQLVAMKELLDHLEAFPQPAVIDSIMAYSKMHGYLA